MCCVMGGMHLREVAVHDEVEAEDLAVELQRLYGVLDAQHRLLHNVRLGHRICLVLVVFHYLIDRGAHDRPRSSTGHGGAAAGEPMRSGVKGKGVPMRSGVKGKGRARGEAEQEVHSPLRRGLTWASRASRARSRMRASRL